jgi:D-serine dehydratase
MVPLNYWRLLQMKTQENVEDFILDDRIKGIPGDVAPFRLGQIGEKGWNVLREDLPLPLAVLKSAAMENNERWMRSFRDLSKIEISPHGKTTMAPQLFQFQMDGKAWGITVSTVHQVQVCLRFGIKRILMANQLVGRQAIKYVLDHLRDDPDFQFYCLVDSVEGVEMLARAASELPAGRPINLLIEGGIPTGRAGCRDVPTALAVGRAIKAAAPHLALRGVEGYEGTVLAKTIEEREERIGAFVDHLASIGTACVKEQLFTEYPVILTAGGSAFYDIVVDHFHAANIGAPIVIVTRSGCYLTHDSLQYEKWFDRIRERNPKIRQISGSFLPALEVWAYVQSCPEPGRVIVTAGKRDISHDAEMPIPEQWFRPGFHRKPQPVVEGEYVLTRIHDQHINLSVPVEHPYKVGDMISFGVSHPCTTFDKWQVIPVVDAEYNVVSAIKTFF